MPEVKALRALHYNLDKTGGLEDVIAPPYDVIDARERARLAAKSPYNVVAIDLPEGNGDPYENAAATLAQWRRDEVIVRDSTPALWLLAQEYTGPDGVQRIRHGILARVRVEDYGEGRIRPHERTHPGPKEDRLRLTRATKANLSPIFSLYDDPEHAVWERLSPMTETQPLGEATGVDGVINRLWRVEDPRLIASITETLSPTELLIADGHHRYETALEYSKEHAPTSVTRTERNLANTTPQPAYPEAAVMMTFVNMDSTGITILPTHRVVFGLKDFSPDRFIDQAQKFFDIQLVRADDSIELTKLLARQSGTSFVAVTRLGYHLLTAKPETVAEALAKLPERQRRLDLTQLHSLVLEQLLGITPEAIREQRNLRYVRDAGEAMEQVWRGEADVAFLTNPITLAQLREVAFAGDVMPQKSTDFYPKLLSGLTIYALD
jgi:uncharacterized protein (DUF1015 family)